MGKQLILIFAVAGWALSAFADDQSDWNLICNGTGNVERLSSDVPQPNYSSPEVYKAAATLVQINTASWYFYREIEQVYGLCVGKYESNGYAHCKGDEPAYANKPGEVDFATHNFLTILCGEYRDNIPVLKQKLRVFTEMNIARPERQVMDNAKDGSPWSQLTGEGYELLIRFSRNLNYLNNAALEPNPHGVKSASPARTQCEFRYIFTEYLAKGLDNPGTLESYQAGFEAFKPACKTGELDVYNEFRGDGNAKPLTMESNAMIWNSRMFAQNCYSPIKAKGRSAITNQDCINYYTRPYQTREKLTKQGLLRLIFYPRAYDGTMQDYKGQLVFITEDLNGDGISEMAVTTGWDAVVVQMRNAIKTLKTDRNYLNEQLKRYKQQLEVSDEAASTEIKQQMDILNGQLQTVSTKLIVLPELVQLAVTNAALKKLTAAESAAVTDAKIFLEKSLNRPTKNGEGVTEPRFMVLANESYFPQVKEILETNGTGGSEVITEVMAGWSKGMLAEKDLGVSKVFADPNEAVERFKTVLDRHTDWYQIDMLLITKGLYQPTYSPWVASSYYIHNSDHFTIPGYAMGLSGDGHKHWMFVQKVPVNNWLRATDVFDKWGQFDLLNSWFDEVTMSRSGLGSSENGWDRPFAPTENEFGTLIWLYEAGNGH